MKHIVKKWLAGILSVVMVFSLLPVMARAEEDGETPEKTAAERVQELIDALPDAETITGDNRADVEAQIAAIDGAMTELSEDEAAALDTARYDAAVAALSALDGQPADPDPEPSAAERVQALIDALPEAETITGDNRADVEAQIDAIDGAMAELTEDEAAALDTARYDAAVAALLALDAPSALEQVQALIDALPEAETVTEDNRADVQAQIDAIDAAMAELTGDEAAALDTARYEAAVAALSALDGQPADPDPEPSAAERVQALIDALPDAETITDDNRADVEAQLAAIDEAKLGLEDEELDGLDITRYMAAVEAILALDGMSGAGEPKTIATTVSNIQYMEYCDGNYIDSRWSSGGTSEVKTCDSATKVESDTTTWTEGWYVVEGSVVINERIKTQGNVHLILTDGCTLTATKGISVTRVTNDKYTTYIERSTLTIHGQSKQTGKLVALSNPENCAAIGADEGTTCGEINIIGATVEATTTSVGGYCIGKTEEKKYISQYEGPLRVYRGHLKLNCGNDSGCFGYYVTRYIVESIIEYSESVSCRRDRPGSEERSNSMYKDTFILSQNFGEPRSGIVYGNATLPEKYYTVPAGGKLTVRGGGNLSVPYGSTLMVQTGGTLQNDGQITNNGTVDIWGNLEGNGSIAPNPPVDHYKLEVTALSLQDAAYGAKPTEQAITIKNTGSETVGIESVTVDKDFDIVSGNTIVNTWIQNTSWKIKPKENLRAGDHNATITVIYNSGRKATAAVTFKVTKATPTVNVSVSGNLTYGSEIKLTANVTATNVDPRELADNVTFKAGSEVLGTVQATSGTATLTIAADNRDLQHKLFGTDGKNVTVTAEYAGNGNIDGKSGTTNVTVKQKTLTFEFTAATRAYDKTRNVTGTFKLTGVLGKDNVDVSAYTAIVESENVGKDKPVTASVTKLGGADAKYYTPGKVDGGTVTISKAGISSVTAPTAKELTYNGGQQGLVTAPVKPDEGTMMYAVGSDSGADGAYSEAIPQKKDAGTYYVWYYVEGDGNHKDSAKNKVSVTIEQKTVTLTWKLDGEDNFNITYDGKAHTVTATATTNVGSETVNVTVDDGKQTDAGSYTATASGLTNGEGGGQASNYKLPTSADKEYTIKKATVSVDTITKELIYTTQPQNVGSVTVKTGDVPALTQGSDYKVVYTAKDAGNSSDGEASKTDVGEYDIWVELSSDKAKKNYEFEGGQDKAKVGTMKIVQAKLTLTIDPVTIIYGDALDNALLNGSKAKIEGEGGATITGTWAWEKVGEYPTVANSGSTNYKVTFTPDTQFAGNFVETTLSTEVTITVKPYELTPVVVASSVESRDYDGTTDVTGDKTLEFEDMSIFSREPFNGTKPTISGTFAFTSKDAGTKTVNVTGIHFDKNGDNYSLSTTEINNATVNGAIAAKEVALSWALDGGAELTTGYTGTEHTVTATATTGVGSETVNVTVTGGKQTDAGDYTATASGLTNGENGGLAANYILPSDVTQEYAITPAPVSFTIGAEDKVDWATRDETNEDPNPEGYVFAEDTTPEDWTDHALSMTYDSYNHKANVTQKAGEAVEILPAGVNGFTVTYKRVKDSAGNNVNEAEVSEIRDAGTYDIMVNLTPTEGKIYNYAFAGQSEDVYSLRVGEITVEPYTVHVTWSHLKYVYHAHKMHPNVRVQNAFKADVQPEVVPDGFDPAVGYSGMLLAFAETGDSKVGDYNVEVELYGTSAGNYVVDDNTETVTIVPAPVTFTVGDNVWVIGEGGALSRNTVTLRPAWGAVSTTPDVAVHHSYPLAGTKLDVDTLNVTIEYWQNGEKVEAPREAGKYEVWVKIGNENYRHSATETGELHHVGELVITDDPNSIRTYTVTFDPGYEGAPKGPAAIEKAFPNQTVVLPPVSGKNEDGTTYDMTRTGYSFLGWSYNGRTYQPNEELHMPAADVTFKGEWIEAVPIGGRVVQESSGGEVTPVNGATVVLKQGSEPTAEAVTGSDGSFDFGLVTPGIYNLEVTYENGGGAKIVKTFLIEVGDSGSVDNEFVLPDTALNTVVEVAPGIKSAVSMDGMITDEAAAEVYTESDKKTVEDGGTVEFKMSISETTLTDDQGEEIPVPEERISMVLDMKLTKTVTSSSGTNTTEITDSKIPVTTVIHLPAEIQGKSGYTVYRFHDEDGDGAEETMQTITTSKNENGEYLQVVREGTAIELHAEFYSTYVLTWYQSSGGGATAYPVTLPENALNGTVTANYEKAVKNSVVTLTVTPDEGHVLGELTVTDSDGNAIALTDNGDGTYSFVMPDGGVTVKAVFMCEGGENCQSRKFTDLDVKAWYHDYTDYVIACGLMHGVGGSLFDPNGAVTRAQMVTVLWNMSGDPVVNYYMTYSDVSESAWYAEAIRWATSEGVVDGYGNGKFGPNDPITREQMAVMLYRYEKKYGDGGFTGEWMYHLPFTDLDQISDWAFEAVAWCNMKGIITGKDGNRVDPKGSAKRCEMAAVLARYRAENDTKNDTE